MGRTKGDEFTVCSRELWLWVEILPEGGGLAARPPVCYILRVARSGQPPCLSFSWSDAAFRPRTGSLDLPFGHSHGSCSGERRHVRYRAPPARRDDAAGPVGMIYDERGSGGG